MKIKTDLRHVFMNIKELKFRGQFVTFFVCLLISALLWLLINLSFSFTTIVSFPVKYLNLPENMILVSVPDTQITLLVKAKGFDLISEKFKFKSTILSVDLDRLKLRHDRSGNKRAFLVSKGMLAKLKNQLSATTEIIKINPDTLWFVFDEKVEKKLPVKPDLEISFEKQFDVYSDIMLVPDSVVVTGPKRYVENLQFVTSKKIMLKNLTTDKTISLPLISKLNNFHLQFSPKKVTAKIDVEQFTEASLELPLEISCNSPNVRLKLFPENVTITYMVAIKDFKTIMAQNFIAGVKCEDVETSMNRKLKVEVREKSNLAKITRIQPDYVEYLIMKQ